MSSAAGEITNSVDRLSDIHDLGLSHATLVSFERRVEGLAERFGEDSLTLIHGDFDPGNLHTLPSGEVTALDWGLCHISTSLADLAHMVERFNEPEQLALADRYLKSLGTDQGIYPTDAVAWGALVHRTFFV